MHRIDTGTAQANKFGDGKPGFRTPDPRAGVLATDLNAAFFDSVQEELANAIEGFGRSLDPDNNSQLLGVLREIHGTPDWTPYTETPVAGNMMNAVAFSPQRRIWGVAQTNADASGTIRRSDDGVTFDPANDVAIGTAYDLRGIAFDGDSWVAVGAHGQIRVNAFDDFSTPAAPAAVPVGTPDLNAVALRPGAWIAVGVGGAIWRSTDEGHHWVDVSPGGAGDFRALAGSPIAGSAIHFVAVCGDGTYWRSGDNGATWTVGTLAGASVYNGVATNGRYWVLGGKEAGGQGWLTIFTDAAPGVAVANAELFAGLPSATGEILAVASGPADSFVASDATRLYWTDMPTAVLGLDGPWRVRRSGLKPMRALVFGGGRWLGVGGDAAGTAWAASPSPW